MIRNVERINSEVYLYTLWCGKIREYRGELWVRHRNERNESYYVKVLDDDGNQVKLLNCWKHEGIVWNKGVWLYESNKRRAAEIMIRNEKKMIAELNFKIKGHEEVIESLKEIVNGG